MTVNVQVLFDRPQREIASLIRDKLAKCESAALIAGFVTVEGIKAIGAPLKRSPGKLDAFVVGAGTYKAYEVFDQLIAAGVDPAKLFVHLGHSRATTGRKAKNRFFRYHPMLHSKIYFFEMPDEQAAAFIGSHNLTGFALLGLNGEASVLLEGPASAPEFLTIREHIDASKGQATAYSPGMKDAYSWWTAEFLDALRAKANDFPRDGETRSTIVVIASRVGSMPKNDDTVYFEIPAALGKIQSLLAEVHLYVFDTFPPSPTVALTLLDRAKGAYRCETTGLEVEGGGVELRADWFIDDRALPELKDTPGQLRPTPSTGMQQVRVKIAGGLSKSFEYLFQSATAKWEPIFNTSNRLVTSEEDRSLLSSDAGEWYLVSGLKPQESDGRDDKQKWALLEASPESGNFILISTRRRERQV